MSAAEILLRLVLTGTQTHYQSRGLIDDKRLEHILLAGKQILYKSHQESDVRQTLGFSPRIWQGLTDVLVRAIPVLEQQSFSWKNPPASSFNGSSSDLIAFQYLSLVKDIERLNDLCTIARNLLATTRKSQNLAAEKGFDQQILKLIDVCVRVTARGFDGETNARNEEKWQKVVNLYKRLLITCLQFLHNLIMHNEQRKLVLWLDLFGTTQATDRDISQDAHQDNGTVNAGTTPAARDTPNPLQPIGGKLADSPNGLGYNIDDIHALFDLMSTENNPDGQTQEAAKSLMNKIRGDMERLSGMKVNQLDDNPEALLRVGAALRAQMPTKDLLALKAAAQGSTQPSSGVVKSSNNNPPSAAAQNIPDIYAYLFGLTNAEGLPDAQTQEMARLLMEKARTDLEKLAIPSAEQLQNDPEAVLKFRTARRAKLIADYNSLAEVSNHLPIQPSSNAAISTSTDPKPSNPMPRPTHWTNFPNFNTYLQLSGQEQEISEDDLSMPKTALQAAETLKEAKDELMARLQDSTGLPEEDGELLYDDETADGLIDDDGHDSHEDSLEDEEEDDDDYPNPGDQERGLLTDVPLVLGPTEIEALPMIIQAGIVDNFGNKHGDKQGTRDMQAVRCHILLAQDAGKNVLRELLIFIAAWDLPDDEFYFKMMVQIMEAILKNGLMSHAYADFGQPKDIISPAQAVVVKILTHIFRAKYSPASVVQSSTDQQPPKARIPAPLSRVDVLTVRYIFTVFRGNIIPETCALIYLQGQIRAGLALAEDFPLNLWDMERVYEGVYQFLEFFAVLTENNDWKRLLVDWEIVYDLVTLIKELDASIPKAALTQMMPPPPLPAGAVAAAQQTTSSSAPMTSTSTNPSLALAERQVDSASGNLHNAAASGGQPNPPPPKSPPPPASTEEPADFEWRNLKKLIVLVLSSLVWKSPVVQNQIRQHGGVEVILGCTQFDAHNPYIKEHAVMCLKFLLESNPENQALVSSLEAREVVKGKDFLKDMGVEVGINDRGQVKVTRTDQAPVSGGNASAAKSSNSSTQNMPPQAREAFDKLNATLKAQMYETGKIVGEVVDEDGFGAVFEGSRSD